MAKKHFHWLLLAWAYVGVVGCGGPEQSPSGTQDAGPAVQPVVQQEAPPKQADPIAAPAASVPEKTSVKTKGAAKSGKQAASKNGVATIVGKALTLISGGVEAGKGGKGKGKGGKGKAEPEEEFQRLDANADGVLTLQEYFGGPQEPEKLQRMTDIFNLLDRNHDGKLTLQEFRNRTKEVEFRRCDSDGNGTLDAEEMRVGFLPASSTRQAQRVFTLMDQNHDGMVTLEEFTPKEPEVQFLRQDKNDDGFLSFEEFGQFSNRLLARNNHAEEAFALADQDHDSRVSAEEFAALLDSKEFAFYRKDKNGDGKLNFEEFAAERIEENAATIKKNFAQKDLDHDGLLTLDEFKAADKPAAAADVAAEIPREVQFKQLDRNGDGLLILEEFLSKRHKAIEIRKWTGTFELLDRDHDGKVTWQEYSNQPKEVFFQRFDDDGNGTLDLKELHQGSVPWATPERAQRFFALVDRNHDEKISPKFDFRTFVC